MMSRSPDQLMKKKSQTKELCPFPTLTFCMDKCIVGGIVFYKHISCLLLFFKEHLELHKHKEKTFGR